MPLSSACILPAIISFIIWLPINCNYCLFQAFEIQRIVLLMGDSKRPNHIAVYKSHDGIDWLPWVYKVSTETGCNTLFGVSLSSQPSNDLGHVCTSYGQPMANQYETVSMNWFWNCPHLGRNYAKGRQLLY